MIIAFVRAFAYRNDIKMKQFQVTIDWKVIFLSAFNYSSFTQPPSRPKHKKNKQIQVSLSHWNAWMDDKEQNKEDPKYGLANDTDFFCPSDL